MNLSQKILTIIIIFAVWINLLSCTDKTEENKQSENYTGNAKIEFLDTIHDFGILKENEIVEYTFKYTNTGTAPLKIKNIETDCGCTIPEYDKKSVLPGEKARIKVTFDSQGFRNNIYKTITVKSNAETSKIKLILTAYIKNNKSLDY